MPENIPIPPITASDPLWKELYHAGAAAILGLVGTETGVLWYILVARDFIRLGWPRLQAVSMAAKP